MKVACGSFCLGLTLVLNSYSMHPGEVHLLTVEDSQGPKAFTSPMAIEKISTLDQKETIALYRSGLNAIAGSSYEKFKINFSALSSSQQSVIFSYFISLFAERSGLQIEASITTEGVMTQSKNSEIYDDINADNKLVSEFIKSAWEGKEISWEIFLGDSIEKTIKSLDVKLSKREFLSGEKEYIDLIELSRSERKLLMALYSLDLLKSSGRGCVNSLMAKLEKFQSFLELFLDLNPYHCYLEDISVTGLGFKDYEKFFNYESLIKLSTALYVASGLNGSGMDATVPLGQLTDNLREFINCFFAYRLNEKDANLFARFLELKEDFPDLE